MYESVIDIEEGNTVTHLVSVDYTLATEEAERIGVDHVARVSNLESGVVSSGEFKPSAKFVFVPIYLQWKNRTKSPIALYALGPSK